MAKMNKQSVYPLKLNPTMQDTLLINDNEDFERTKTATLGTAFGLINSYNGQINYRFSNGTNTDQIDNPPGYFFTNENLETFPEVTTLMISRFNSAFKDLTELYDFMLAHPTKFLIKLQKTDDPNVFAYLNMTKLYNVDGEFIFGVELLEDLFENFLEDEVLYTLTFILKAGGVGVVDAVDVTYLNGTFTNVQQALDSLLYLSPAITSFTNDKELVEKGSTVTSVKFNWGYNKTMVTANISNGIGDVIGMTELILLMQNITTNQNYTLTANDGTANVTKSTAIKFLNKRYWGTSAEANLNAVDILTLSGSELSESRLMTQTINGAGKYMYFAYPSSFGAAEFIVNGLTNTAFSFVVRSFTNSKGFTENYNVYRTNTIQNGTLTIQIK